MNVMTTKYRPTITSTRYYREADILAVSFGQIFLSAGSVTY